MQSRRSFLKTAAAVGVSSSLFASEERPALLNEFGYGDVQLAPGPLQQQFENTQSVLLSLNEDSLLKPFRLRAGLPAPGPDLGGWYDEVPLDKTESGGHGFAPAHCFGQWISALARGYAVNHDPRTKARLERLLALYEPTISGRFYSNFRFPAYNYDKLVCGLIDTHQFASLPQAFPLLERTTAAAEPHLPPTALDRDEPQRKWRASIGESTANDYTWDESYTLPENLYLAAQRGAGERYRKLAGRFLLDRTYFDPLSENRNVLPNHHAYSFCNALSSAMQAYISTGSQKHLRAASNAWQIIDTTQSFATGGWGPNESFVEPNTGALYASLKDTHRGFETPCGSYAHFKLTRYLLRVTRDGRYGDSMERVLYNTVSGAKPLERDGHAFYYSDYNFVGRKTYFPDAWPCCSGTLPQVAADYRILIYFRDPGGLYVNLYLPSTLKWTSADGAQLALTQSGDYPLDSRIHLSLRASRASAFNLRLRIPAWAAQASLQVNGKPATLKAENGFASINRRWKDGDRIELNLPLATRREPIDEQHPETVAVVRGPLVLFPITGEPRKLLPFSAIHDEPYSTYVTRS
ncbi:MAG TPA: beta-L-arabinofuranosidase domain-containing protein [Bryobacteraceae bacterium]|nr:beta-L-arabinofuranosidase domain-containing protein [Bryobacteraceae bacterium]